MVIAFFLAFIHTEEIINSISIIGRTGDGKSSFCNLLAKHFNYNEHNPFDDGPGANLHTTAPKTIVVNRTFQITDNPDLMDANGINQDEQNIVNIVTYAKRIGNQKGFILVINSEMPAFNKGMRSTVKLFFDSFGPQFLSHLGILFTKEKNDNITSSKEKVDEYKSIISQMTGHEIGHLPFWMVDNYPEDFSSFHIPGARIETIRERNKRTMEQIKAWSAQLNYIKMDDQCAEYESTKCIRYAYEEAGRNRFNLINPKMTQGETFKSHHDKSTDQCEKKECVTFGGRQKKDHLDESTYRTECRSIFLC
jgi:hypothetical protein